MFIAGVVQEDTFTHLIMYHFSRRRSMALGPNEQICSFELKENSRVHAQLRIYE